MSSIDNRIVSMKFDNASFEKGVSTTLSTLGKLKQALSFSGASKGLNDLDTAAGRFNLGPMEGAVTHVSKSFLAMSTVAITALANITTRAVDAGIKFAKALTLDPIKAGFTNYETQINAIQTILANTAAQGTKLKDVNKALAELNTYANKTVYNFSEMAHNIGTFTAAGVDLKTSTAAIKGIANLAAMSGSSSQQASTAMYQLSQAISTGTVRLMDWNSVVNAGMGGQVFQTALENTARASGVAIDKILKKTGSFRNSLQEGWLTSKILTKTLEQFTGDLSKSQIKAMGFTDKEAQAIMKQGQTAVNAATKIKTATQLVDALKEEVATAWATVFKTLFGNINEAKKNFSALHTTMENALTKPIYAFNKVLEGWKSMGGKVLVIDAIKNSFHALMDILKPIKDAFREIFPPATAKDLYNITKAIDNFTKKLTIGSTTADNLQRSFAGVFAIFDILWQAIKGLAQGIGTLLGAFSQGSGGLLNFTGNLGDLLVSLDNAIKKGGFFTKFFETLGQILAVPIKLVEALAGYIGDLFSGFQGSQAQDLDKALGGIGDKLSPLSALGQRVHSIFTGLATAFGKVGQVLAPVGDAIGRAMHAIGAALDDAFSGDNFNTVLDAINTGLFGGILLLFSKFIKQFKKGISLNFDAGGGMFATIKDSFETLTGTLKTMQTNIKADTLQKIAIAIGILTISIVALSLIDSAKLTKSLSAIAVGFGELLGSMAILSKISGSAGFVKIPVIATSMILLSTAVLILSAAVRNMSGLSWGELTKGLIGVAGALTVLSVAVKVMSGSKNLATIGFGLIIVGAGLMIIAKAVNSFGQMDWATMGKGLLGIAGALLIIAGAIAIIPVTLPITAAGLILVGAALLEIGQAVSNMGSMSWEEIAKGLVTLAGSLIILAGGLYLMTGALGGAAALVVAAGALAILAPVLVVLGSMSWMGIVKGLVALAGAFTVIGVAGLLLTPLIPSLIGLGAAMTLLGAGLALAGAGALAFATAFGIVVAAGSAGVAIMGKMIGTFVKAIPQAIKAFGQGVVEFARVIGKAGPAFVKAFTAILKSLVEAVIRTTPKIGKAIDTLVKTGLHVLVTNIPKMVDAGMKLILGILRGIDQNIGKIVNVAGDIIVKFLNAIGKQIPRIINAGVSLILKFINGLTKAINSHSAELGAAAGHLAVAIIQGMVKGMAGGISVVAAAAKHLAESALNAVKSFLGIHSPSREFEKLGRYVDQGFAKGIVGGSDDVKNAFQDLNSKIKDTMQSLRSTVSDEQDKLKQLLDAKVQDMDAIDKARQKLAMAQAMEKAAKAAHEDLVKNLTKQKADLLTLSKQYDDIATKIDNARQALQNAIQTRNDASKSIAGQYSNMPDITGDTTPQDYTNALETEAQQTETFLKSLNQLSKLGLDDAAYKKLLDQGLGAQPFVDKLIEAGPQAVKALNNASDDLTAAAKALGKAGSRELYQAGVDTARGLLQGLRSKEDEIRAEMQKIANMMTRKIKKDLKIKSPSRVFAEIGRYSSEGLAMGLSNYSHLVEQSASNVATTAVDTVKATLSDISNIAPKSVEVHPVITPVLDLSKVQKDASKINSMMPSKAMVAEVSYGQAASISNTREAARSTASDVTTPPPPAPVVKFEQNNYSPKSLSAVEIYRQTRNQLSIAKEALTT